MSEEMDYGVDILTLQDEDGVEHEFEIADTLEHKGNSYMALVPVLDEAEEILEDDGELIILKVIRDGEDEYLEPIDDEDEFAEVSEIFMKNLEDMYDFSDEDEEAGEE